MHAAAAAAAATSLQSCPTLCDPIDGSPLGSSLSGILQARTVEWAAISFSKKKKLPHVKEASSRECNHSTLAKEKSRNQGGQVITVVDSPSLGQFYSPVLSLKV